jgi:outer membrane biosynthesis protein TonB
MPPLPTKPPTPTPTQQPTTTPKPTETPTATPTSTPILPTSPEPTTPQLANEQTDQEPASTSYSPSYNTIIILAVTITLSIIASFLFLRQKANLTSHGHPNDLPLKFVTLGWRCVAYKNLSLEKY